MESPMPRDLPDDRQPVTLLEAMERIDALHGDLRALGHQRVVAMLKLDGGSRACAFLYPIGYAGDGQVFPADDPADALAALEAAARALPDPGEQERRAAIKALLNAVDGCRDAGLDADFVNPLADAARKLVERALPAPTA